MIPPVVEIFARLIVAYALMLLLVVLNSVSFALPYAGALQPSFVLMGVYFWALYRPMLFPPLALFIIGVLLDALLGLPMGISAIVFLGTHWLTRSQRRFLTGQVFVIQWVGFAVITFCATLFQWLVMALAGQGFVQIMPPLLQAFATALLYPLVLFPLFAIHRLLPLPRKIVS